MEFQQICRKNNKLSKFVELIMNNTNSQYEGKNYATLILFCGASAALTIALMSYMTSQVVGLL